MKSIGDMFDKFEDDFLRFEFVENKKHRRPDICAFIILNELVPSDTDIISAAEHDEIFLNVNLDDLVKVITEDQVHDLVCCGVRYSDEYDSLCMFV
jgi:hypothetical protein